MDYANQRRLKILGRAERCEVGADQGLASRLAIPGYATVVERALVVRIAGFDWNCPQHITPRFTLAEVEQAMTPLRQRVAASQGINLPSTIPINQSLGISLLSLSESGRRGFGAWPATP
jgi:hypothetical protein